MSGVFTIPSHVSFVNALATRLWQEAAGEPLRLSDTLVLLPTRRACRNLREAFLTLTKHAAPIQTAIPSRAALLPRMQPLGDMDENELYFTAQGIAAEIVTMPPAISPLRRRLLLSQFVMKKDKSISPDQALRLAASLATLLDQVQTERGDFADLAALVPNNPTNQLAEHWQETLRFLEIITDTWPTVLADEGCIDPSVRRNLILSAQAKAWRDHPPAFPIIAAGSTASIPAVAELLDVIAHLPHGRVVLPGLDASLPENAWQKVDESHPQYGMKHWLESAGYKRTDVTCWVEDAPTPAPRMHLLREAMLPPDVTDSWRQLNAQDVPAEALTEITVLEADDTQTEAETIALYLREELEQPQNTAAIVTPDRALAERVAAALRRWGIETNDSAGTALARLPLGGFLKSALRAAAPNVSAIDSLTLLKHPLTGGGIATPDCRRLARVAEIDVWRHRNPPIGWKLSAQALIAMATPDNATQPHQRIYASRADLTAAANLLNRIHTWTTDVMTQWGDLLPFTDRLTAHIALVEALATTESDDGASRLWQGAAGEAAVVWLDDLRQASKDFPPLNGTDYENIFACLSEDVPVRQSWGRHPRIDILGPLEARLHHADIMILAGLNDGTWPQEATADPWMSRPMKKQMNLVSPERRIGLSAHDFVQFAAAPRVILTRSRRNGDQPTVPSRFLLRLQTVIQALGYKDLLKTSRQHLQWAQSLDKPVSIVPCRQPQPCPPVIMRPRCLSVTEIGTWRRNPYAIYAKHILKLIKLDDIQPEVDRAERGTILHRIFEIVINECRDNNTLLQLERVLEIGRQEFAVYSHDPQVAALWWPRFITIAKWVIEQEGDRRTDGTKNIATEIRSTMAFNFGAEIFTLSGRADRIDRLADGTLEIIDYKTGTAPSVKVIAEGYDPQLPLLAAIMEATDWKGHPAGSHNVSALAYWKLSGKLSKDTNGGEISVLKPPKGEDERDTWLRRLIADEVVRFQALLDEFSQATTGYCDTPDPRYAPRYNDYAHLARTGEWMEGQ